MRFQLKMNITEEDFLRCVYFRNLESARGKKELFQNRMRILACYAILTAMIIAIRRPAAKTALLCLAFFAAYSSVHMLLYKYLVKVRLKRWLQKTLKTGDSHFDPEAKYEFHEDKMVEVTELTHLERRYDGVSAVNIIGNELIEICHGASGCILPISQIRQQVDYDAFVQFLREKCANAEVDAGK